MKFGILSLQSFIIKHYIIWSGLIMISWYRLHMYITDPHCLMWKKEGKKGSCCIKPLICNFGMEWNYVFRSRWGAKLCEIRFYSQTSSSHSWVKTKRKRNICIHVQGLKNTLYAIPFSNNSIHIVERWVRKKILSTHKIDTWLIWRRSSVNPINKQV